MAILLLKDWQFYPTAIIDYQTKNQSFVRLASIYRMMNISNSNFILALHNPALQGVDPHDPNLTIEQMAAITIEAQDNPWYVLREVLRAPGLAGGESVPVEANRSIIALWWCFYCHIMIILIQPRQTGKSFGTDGLMASLLNFVCYKTDINLLTKNDDLRRKNIQRVKDIIYELPPYLRMMGRDDSNNGQNITVRTRGNTYNTHVPQASKKNALKLGRGLTSPILHGDEVPFQPNIAISLPAALAAGGAAIDRAKLNNAPYGTILTTTAGKRDDPDGAYIFKLLNDSAPWTEKYYDAENEEDLERIIRNSSRGAYRVACVFSHRMLGKTDAWLKQKLEESLQEGEDAARDFLNQWTAGNAGNPLSVEQLERISNSQQEPKYVEIDKNYGYVIRWHIAENEINRRMSSSKFFIGTDTSEVSGGDDTGSVILDIETGDVVAAFTINETNILTLVEWYCTLFVRFPNLVAIPERRSTGTTLLDYLLLKLPSYGIDPFKVIFNTVVQNADEHPEAFAEINKPLNRRLNDVYIKYKKHFGFATSGSGMGSRSELYGSCLKVSANRCADRVYDPILVNQINTLTTRNGRVDHAVGQHDDMVIGWLLAQWFCIHGKNLSFYGIEPRQIMSRLVIKDSYSNTDRSSVVNFEQIRIRRRIEDIYDLLIAETDEFVISKLEQELRILDRKIILEAGENYSIDEIIRQTKESRKVSKLRKRYG